MELFCVLALSTIFVVGSNASPQPSFGLHCGNPDLTQVEDDFYRNVTELITSKGYPCIDHNVVTEDGFILTLHRIPHGVHDKSAQAQRPVVFLQHGLLDSASTWLINPASESLGFILADAGFDVWLGNLRGNTYSRRHVNLKPDDSRFWAWSWDEMAKYDIPAMLRFVMNTTGQPSLFYIGHSEGTLVAFAGFSQDQQLAKQIKAFVGFGPVATLGHVRGLARLLVDLTPEIQIIFELYGKNEFMPSSKIVKFLASTLCTARVSRYICESIVFSLAGTDCAQMNVTRLPVYLSHTPAGTSVQNVVHFAQMVKTNKFEMYDFGSEELNRQHYNQPFPPLYNISNFKVPAYLYSGEKDVLSEPQDVKYLVSQLQSLKLHKQIPKWDHLDFVWGVNANTILYKEVIKVLRSYL